MPSPQSMMRDATAGAVDRLRGIGRPMRAGHVELANAAGPVDADALARARHAARMEELQALAAYGNPQANGDPLAAWQGFSDLPVWSTVTSMLEAHKQQGASRLQGGDPGVHTDPVVGYNPGNDIIQHLMSGNDPQRLYEAMKIYQEQLRQPDPSASALSFVRGTTRGGQQAWRDWSPGASPDSIAAQRVGASPGPGAPEAPPDAWAGANGINGRQELSRRDPGGRMAPTGSALNPQAQMGNPTQQSAAGPAGPGTGANFLRRLMGARTGRF